MRPLDYLWLLAGFYFGGRGVTALMNPDGMYNVFGISLNHLAFGALYLIVAGSFLLDFYRKWKRAQGR